MSLSLISVKCPECGASLNIEEGRSQVFCSYCGTKIIINNENEFIYRTIDEAEIKKAETDRILKLREIELNEKKHENDEKIKSKRTKGFLIFLIIGLFMMFFGSFMGESSGNPNSSFYVVGLVGMMMAIIAGCGLIPASDTHDDSDGKIRVPGSVIDYKKKNYKAVESILRSAGFLNIECIPLHDLTTGFLKKEGTVESITINGNNYFSFKERFSNDAAIVISYHSF